MKTRFVHLTLLVLACACLAGIASAQDIKVQPKGKYVVLPARLRYDLKAPAASLQT